MMRMPHHAHAGAAVVRPNDTNKVNNRCQRLFASTLSPVSLAARCAHVSVSPGEADDRCRHYLSQSLEETSRLPWRDISGLLPVTRMSTAERPSAQRHPH